MLQELRAGHVEGHGGPGGGAMAVGSVPSHGLDHRLPLSEQRGTVLRKGQPHIKDTHILTPHIDVYI